MHQYQLENQKDWKVFLLAGFRVMASGGKEAWDPNAAGWMAKWWINLESDILPTCDTEKENAIACTIIHKIWCLDQAVV